MNLINEVKKVYENASSVDAGWYALAYYYLSLNNENLLKGMIDEETGSAEFSIDRISQYGFPVDSSDIIQKKLHIYYEKKAYLNHTYTPNTDFRYYLWNAANTASNIMNVDTAKYKQMTLEYLLAEINFDNGITGISASVTTFSSDDTLGTTSGTTSVNLGDSVTVTATPYANVVFHAWVDEETGAAVSRSESYTFTVNSARTLKAVFVAGNVKTASNPIVSNTPVGATYYAGQSAVPLSVSATSTDGGSISIAWYKNNTNKNYGGSYVGSGSSYLPNTLQKGTYYYYAVITNTLDYRVGTNVTTTSVSYNTNAACVYVTNPILTGLNLEKNPSKTTYYLDETFDTSDITVQALYSDGTTVIIDDYVASYDFTTIGAKTVTISYFGKQLELSVEVKENTISSISVINLPTFYLGEEETINEMVLQLTYDNGATEFTTDYTVENFDANQLGEQTVTVKYGELSTDITVTVVKIPFDYVDFGSIENQVYTGDNLPITPEITLTSTISSETLVKDIDYTVSYSNNILPGTATVTVTGIGKYCSTKDITFAIVCEHSYNGDIDFDCNICGFIRNIELNGIIYKLVDDEVSVSGVADSENIANVVIPASIGKYPVIKIANNAFDGCTTLKSIDLPNSITVIGNYAFRGCTALESINIPNSVTSLGIAAFYNCTALKNVIMSDNITELNDVVFYNCILLNDVVIPNTITTIKRGAFFNCTGLEGITIPDLVTYIGECAFYKCKNLVTVKIGNSVETIGPSAFEECRSLKSIEIPKSVTKIEDYAFCYCDKLESVVIHNSLHSIGNLIINSSPNFAQIYYFGTKAELQQIAIGTNNSILKSACIIYSVYGDVNSDGDITSKDVTILRRYLAGGYDVTINTAAADVNKDGDITSKDVTLLRRYLAGGWDVVLE